MKYGFVIIVLSSIYAANAQTLSVENIRVSVKAESAASAREQAIEQAHQLAFQKLIDENFPESTNSLPSTEFVEGLVRDFSIEREKTTPTSYTASLTFQFDAPRVIAWIHQTPQKSSHRALTQQKYEENSSLKVTASYGTHAEWQYIRKTVENFPGVEKLSIFTLSPKNANLEIIYGGSFDILEKGLLQKGILLSQEKEGWLISSKVETLR
jgi:hypothetical protein